MKLSDLVELAKAGYKFQEIKELLEYVETSPAVQGATPDITPDDVPDNTPEPEPEPEPVKPQVKPQEKKEEDGESVLDKLFD
jgi:hypothetical protein